MSYHNINLNIHYTMPDPVRGKFNEVYASMPYWAGEEKQPCWKACDVDLVASVEPGGLQIYGEMPEEIWEGWYSELKEKLTAALGYEIGESEDGHEFGQLP